MNLGLAKNNQAKYTVTVLLCCNNFLENNLLTEVDAKFVVCARLCYAVRIFLAILELIVFLVLCRKHTSSVAPAAWVPEESNDLKSRALNQPYIALLYMGVSKGGL